VVVDQAWNALPLCNGQISKPNGGALREASGPVPRSHRCRRGKEITASHLNLPPRWRDELQGVRALAMTDMQAATNMEVAVAAGTTVDATREPQLPLGVIVFAVVAFGTEALWLGLIGWWLLNLF
jgi:hypothetical protein